MTASPPPIGVTLEFMLSGKPSLAGDKQPATAERIPRIAKLLALAIQFEGMLQQGQIHNCAAIARAGHVSRARLSQLLSLLDLAPTIQEQILFLSCPAQAPDPIRERALRSVTKVVRWDEQRRHFAGLLTSSRSQRQWKPGVAPGSAHDGRQASST
jgi:hypothetical protein